MTELNDVSKQIQNLYSFKDNMALLKFTRVGRDSKPLKAVDG